PAGEVWSKLAEMVRRQYEDEFGRQWPIEAFGVDAGYLSQKVYAFCHRLASTERVYALDGRPKWKEPPLAMPSKIDVDQDGKKIGAILLWPVGTWDLKSEWYSALAKTLEGPDKTGRWQVGAAHFNFNTDRGYFEQATSEHIEDKIHRQTGLTLKMWVRAGKQPNERLDIQVYARALAHHKLDHLTQSQWLALAAQRAQRPDQVQQDFAELWNKPDLKVPVGELVERPAPAETRSPAPAAAEQASSEAVAARSPQEASPQVATPAPPPRAQPPRTVLRWQRLH
ncbi:MAG: hypothetical protein FJ271_34430, partial [Planctomycetes bacterium]|nr:hypothetical protein [Planctomycetota bacterium]